MIGEGFAIYLSFYESDQLPLALEERHHQQGENPRFNITRPNTLKVELEAIIENLGAEFLGNQILLTCLKIEKQKRLKGYLSRISGQISSRVKFRQYVVTGNIICPSTITGLDHLKDARMNKGLAFTLEERQCLGIQGLQAARCKTQDEQLEHCRCSLDSFQEDIDRYTFLNDLHDRNERLFFRLFDENIEELLPIVYTPTVGLACQRFGLIYRRPRGLFITQHDRGHIFNVLRNWPEHDVRAIVVTDGERILGLGDLGAYGMGIPVGKLSLYTALAGIKPHQCLPILIDVGTNNEDLFKDPLYIGVRQKRLAGEEYDSLIDEFMQAVVKRYGQNTLIQFEDFGNRNAFRYLEKYRNHYCTFNDDIQGTAAVAVAGIYASKLLTGKKFSDNKILFAGAGGAALGIADLCVKAMEAEGLSLEDARNNIYMFDINGLLTKGRTDGPIDGQKKYYAKNLPPMKDPAEIVKKIQPSVLIGATTTPGLFTPAILKDMASFNERPIVFALSNPTSKAECTAEQAYENTDGRVIFSSGSPFPPVTYKGKTFTPGQGNNAYIFPGVALGIIATEAHHIPDDIFLLAAAELSNHITKEDLEKGCIYPSFSKIRAVSLDIAIAVTKFAYDKDLASTYPEPADPRKWLQDQLYNFHYECSLPVKY